MSHQDPMNPNDPQRKPTTTPGSTTDAGTRAAGATGTGTAGKSTASDRPRTFEDERKDPWTERPEGRRRESLYGDDAAHRERIRGFRESSYGGNGESRSVMATLRGLASDVGLLARQEAQLARTEIGEKIDQVKKGVGELGLGSALAYAGFLFVLAAAVFGLDLALERLWLSTLIVGAVVHLIGLAMLGSARKNLKTDNLKPERTARSLREDVDMARNETTRRTHV